MISVYRSNETFSFSCVSRVSPREMMVCTAARTLPSLYSPGWAMRVRQSQTRLVEQNCSTLQARRRASSKSCVRTRVRCQSNLLTVNFTHILNPLTSNGCIRLSLLRSHCHLVSCPVFTVDQFKSLVEQLITGIIKDYTQSVDRDPLGWFDLRKSTWFKKIWLVNSSRKRARAMNIIDLT